jgi:hypothetical protein
LGGIENALFAGAYYGLTAALTLLLIYIAYFGLRIRRALAGLVDRSQALGASLIALGVAVSLVCGVSRWSSTGSTPRF